VIVDDSQLSLAIGKKGQNVRLAAKLLGWRVDIKSEEEKRQEVESQMEALVVPGAPVSVLVDHGIPDTLVEKLMEAGVATVEQLGGMTPEQLEEITGIGVEMVEKIQEAVVSYYGQFESGPETEAAVGEAAPEPVAAADGALTDGVSTEAPPEQSVTIEIAESPVGAEAPDKEQGLI